MTRDLRPGDRVALLVPGSPAYVDLVIALAAERVVPVPLDPRLTPSERQALLSYLSPRLVLETPDRRRGRCWTRSATCGASPPTT
jgi:long-chain acyl-CoA synthetase